jgi:hypothetical protein
VILKVVCSTAGAAFIASGPSVPLAGFAPASRGLERTLAKSLLCEVAVPRPVRNLPLRFRATPRRSPSGVLKMLFAAEYLIFILASALVSACVMDEEPVLDLTDLGAAHVLVFAAALLIVSADNLVKMSRGQYANSDRQVFSYAGFKSGALIFYFMLVSGLFFSHVTPPLLVDGVEVVTM